MLWCSKHGELWIGKQNPLDLIVVTSPEHVFLQSIDLIMYELINLLEEKGRLPTGDQFSNFGCQSF